MLAETARAMAGVAVRIKQDVKLGYEKGKRKMSNLLKRLWQEEEGQDLIEYALLIALIALAATLGMNSLADSINNEFTNVGTSLTNVTT